MNEKPYIVYYEELSELVGFDGAAICAKVLSMTDKQGVARISLQYLCKIGKLSKGALKRLLLRLQVFGYIEYQTFEGKGRLTEFRKGSNLIPFEYDYLMPSRTEDLISAKKRGKHIFINSKNERIKLF